MASVLIVEDEVGVSINLEFSLPQLGYSIAASVVDGPSAIEKAAELHPDIVLLDINLQGEMDGITTAERINSEFRIPVVYLTSYPDDETLIRAKLTQPFGYVVKPFGFRELHATLQMALYRKRVEEELLRSNEDLQQFAYAASHDLQEPLRNITLSAQLLSRYMEGRLLPQEQELVDDIVNSTRRMNDLVVGLLSYGRVAHGPRDADRFPSHQAVEAALRNLRPYLEENGACVNYRDLPEVTADRVQVIAVFQNLIANAIKYQNGGPAQIEITAEPHNGHQVFCVSDNGIGIAQRHQTRIFQMFSRLHPKHYPGTGIGLAICKRVVERHGGRIWVESDEGSGSRFFFSLPAAAPHQS